MSRNIKKQQLPKAMAEWFRSVSDGKVAHYMARALGVSDDALKNVLDNEQPQVTAWGLGSLTKALTKWAADPAGLEAEYERFAEENRKRVARNSEAREKAKRAEGAAAQGMPLPEGIDRLSARVEATNARLGEALAEGMESTRAIREDLDKLRAKIDLLLDSYGLLKANGNGGRG